MEVGTVGPDTVVVEVSAVDVELVETRASIDKVEVVVVSDIAA